jgi:putative phosphoesterase
MSAYILVTGDLHAGSEADVPHALLRLADAADAVILTGDMQSVDAVDVLAALAPVYGVAGNVDGHDIRSRLSMEFEGTVAGVTIAAMHDSGESHGRRERLLARYRDAAVIAYGHTHVADVAKVGQVWLINPGSPTRPRGADRTPTAAWITVAEFGVARVELVSIN